MTKLTNLVVDQNFRLLGFVVQGSPRDFGEFEADSKVKVHKTLSLQYLFNINFNNRQISMKKNTIVEKEGFKLSSLKMVMFTGTEYINIDNTIELTKRYVKDNQNIGFDAIISGDRNIKISYENTINLCNLFKPLNFVVRNNSKGTKKYIAGKTGESLSSLPVEYIGEKPSAKKLKSSATGVSEITGDFKKDIDIFDLYNFIRNVNGFIVNLPGTEYKATTTTVCASKEFVPFNIGEVGSPWLDFNESKFNISCNFKKPGAVIINLGNKPTNIITFVHRRKNIFFNGENYISRLGVVIPESAEESLLNTFSRSMSFTEIKDQGVLTPISMLIAQTNVKMYEVDTSKVGIMTKDKAAEYLLNCHKIYSDVYRITENKLKLKFLNGMVKELRDEARVSSVDAVKSIAPQFAAMTNEDLITLSENGIDIYSGAFINKDETTKRTGNSTGEEVEVQYAIEGFSANNITYKDMVNSSPKVPAFLIEFINKITSIDDLEKRGAVIKEYIEKLDRENNSIKRELWLHKAAMYILSNKTSVHSHDKKNWQLNTKKRTKSTCYDCIVKGCEKLQLLVLNIDIK